MLPHRERLDDLNRRLAAIHGVASGELAQEIVNASADCLEAMSAALYMRGADGRLVAVATAGLFPPVQHVEPTALGDRSTRVRLFERVFRAVEPLGADHPVTRVWQHGRGERIADASTVPGLPRHTDPALTLCSLIIVPLLLDGAPRGVLVLANPVCGRPFSPEEFTLAESVASGVVGALGPAGLRKLGGS
jgi:GAF domain-containing protein